MKPLRTFSLRIPLAILLPSAALAVTSSATPETNQVFVRFDSGRSSPPIPIELSGNGIPFVRGQLGEATLWFLLNTVSPSVLSRKAAAAAGLEGETSPSGRETPEGVVRVERIAKVTVRLTGVDIDERDVSSFDLDPLQMSLGHPVDGILGTPFFDRLVVVLNYPALRMELSDPKSFHYSGRGREVSIRRRSGLPIAEARLKVQGRTELKGDFLLNSASDQAVFLFAPFVTAHRLMDPTSAPPGSETADSATASLAGVLRAEKIELGPFAFSGPVLELSRSGRGITADKELAGIVGSAILSRFRVAWDCSHDRMFLEKSTHYADPFPYDASGVSLAAQGPDLSTFEVRRIAPGSPAAQAQLAVGDVLLAVDGKPVKGITLPGVRKLFQQDGKEYLLSVFRDGAIEKIRLKCRRML